MSTSKATTPEQSRPPRDCGADGKQYTSGWRARVRGQPNAGWASEAWRTGWSEANYALAIGRDIMWSADE